MKSTKYKLVARGSFGAQYEIWSHRRFRGWVRYVEEFQERWVETPYFEASYNTLLVKGWRVEAPDGTKILGCHGYIFETRNKATVRLLTDHRFNKKVK